MTGVPMPVGPTPPTLARTAAGPAGPAGRARPGADAADQGAETGVPQGDFAAVVAALLASAPPAQGAGVVPGTPGLPAASLAGPNLQAQAGPGAGLLPGLPAEAADIPSPAAGTIVLTAQPAGGTSPATVPIPDADLAAAALQSATLTYAPAGTREQLPPAPVGLLPAAAAAAAAAATVVVDAVAGVGAGAQGQPGGDAAVPAAAAVRPEQAQGTADVPAAGAATTGPPLLPAAAIPGAGTAATGEVPAAEVLLEPRAGAGDPVAQALQSLPAERLEQPSAGPIPSAAPQTAAAPSTAAPVAATPLPAYTSAPPVAAQLVGHVAPLRGLADGVHRMVIELHPAELGAVQVVAELRDGAVHLQLNGATDVGRETLRGALSDLRRDLADAGFGEATVDVGSDAPGPRDGGRSSAADTGSQGSGQQPPARDSRSGSGTARPGDPTRHPDVSSSGAAPAPRVSTGTRAIDVRV